MTTSYYDVIIIGGGIHGAGVAQAAAANGYSVLLLEKSAIGAATSSKSSKLIHGGLRYLESHQYKLVRECLNERAILLRNAPDLVKLLPFYIPVFTNTTRHAWKIHAGLYLYKLLGGFDKHYGFRKLAHADWPMLDNLKQDGLLAVFQYFDAQTDDAALTKAVAHSAQTLGAEISVPTEFINAEIKTQACVVHAMHGGTEELYQCGVLINAAGPWVNNVLSNCDPCSEQALVDYVQGTHIVINEANKKGVFYVEAPADQRAVFVIPWRNQTMVGTTETVVTQPVWDVVPLKAEIDYLLDTFNAYFPQSRKTNQDIVEAFAGLRVLPRAATEFFHRQRDTQLLVNTNFKPRLVSMVGGKLTAYRATAEKVIERIAGSLPQRKRRAATDKLALHPVE